MTGFEDHFAERAELMRQIAASGQSDDMTRAIDLVVEALSARRPVLVCGNGGSAADAEHIAAELVGRFRRDRPPFNALALVGNAATTSALANDYGFEQVFARQVHAYGVPDAVLIVLSASGNSPSVLSAARAAHEIGMGVIGLTGATGGSLAGLVDVVLRVPSEDVALIQEGHAALYHLLCRQVEERLSPGDIR